MKLYEPRAPYSSGSARLRDQGEKEKKGRRDKSVRHARRVSVSSPSWQPLRPCTMAAAREGAPLPLADPSITRAVLAFSADSRECSPQPSPRPIEEVDALWQAILAFAPSRSASSALLPASSEKDLLSALPQVKLGRRSLPEGAGGGATSPAAPAVPAPQELPPRQHTLSPAKQLALSLEAARLELAARPPSTAPVASPSHEARAFMSQLLHQETGGGCGADAAPKGGAPPPLQLSPSVALVLARLPPLTAPQAAAGQEPAGAGPPLSPIPLPSLESSPAAWEAWLAARGEEK